jgi:hypothetical protein
MTMIPGVLCTLCSAGSCETQNMYGSHGRDGRGEGGDVDQNKKL